MTESRDSGTSGTTPPPAARPSPAPSRPGPNAENMHTELDDDASGDSPSPGTLAARDGEIMPPPPARPPHVGDHLDLEELRRAYDIYHRTPSPNLVDALRMHFQGVRGDRRFAAALLPHGATNICVRQLQALLTLGHRTPDDLIDVWIWWFNYHQPDRGRVWVPHLAWAHTLIAPPTEPRPAPNPGGRTRAAPQLSADALNIPPHGGLAYWESRSARERGQNLRTMTERYAQTAGPGAHAEPPPRDTPSTVAMVVLESGHYCQVRITPRPLENHWDLEAADSMLPRDVDLPDGPTPLLPGQPPDLLTAIVSGEAGTWHPEHALYCLWRWAQRRWPHTRDWSAAWRFHLDGRQQTEAIPPHERTAGRPTTDNLCPVFAIHQIRALAAGQVSPAIHTEEEARAAHTALVSDIFAALRTALTRHPGNPDALTFLMP